MKTQLEIIRKQKEKSFKILTATKKSLENAIKSAQAFIDANWNEIHKKENEAAELKATNAELEGDIKQMCASCTEIEKIMGVN